MSASAPMAPSAATSTSTEASLAREANRTTKNVVGLSQGGGGNPAACIELASSIDASTATLIATPNNRSGSSANWNNTAFEERPLGYCSSGSNVVEVDTSLSNSPGAALKSAIAFMVP